MNIDNQQIIDFLKSQGDPAKAGQADNASADAPMAR